VYYSRYEDLSETERRELKEWMELQYAKSSVNLKDGYNPRVQSMRLYLDPLLYIHRPLILYTVMKATDLGTHLWLYWMGFRQYHCSRVSFWIWQDETEKGKKLTQDDTPVVLVHGIGAGLMPYLGLIRMLRYLPPANRPPALFLVELPHISMQLHETIPTSWQTTDAIRSALARYGGWQRARFIGHSYGTYVVAWCIKQCPSLVAGAILIDPVCFLTFTPTTAYSFLYKKPVTTEEHMIYFFVSREPFVAHTLTRHFWWWENCLWAEEVRDIPVVAYLSGQDMIVSSTAVRRYLLKHNIQAVCFPELHHAQFILDPKAMKEIVSCVVNHCDRDKRTVQRSNDSERHF